MHALRERQLAFGDAVMHGGGYALQHVRGNGLSPAQRIAIYRNNVHETLIAALRSTYPVVEKLVGGDFFRMAAGQHVRAYPSTAGDVRRYGGGFAQFLENFEPAAGLPYLADVARLEWAWNEAFNAPDAGTAPDLAALAQIPQADWGRVAFRLAPATRLVSSLYPVLRIWQINQDDHRGDARVSLDEGGVHLLVLRRQLAVEIQPLNIAEFAFLAALQRGEPLADALEPGYAADPGFAPGNILQKHIALGTFAGWHLPDASGVTSIFP